MGGTSNNNFRNDVWRSTDNGATWTLVTAGAGWPGRCGHSSAATPDGGIVLTGGNVGGTWPLERNDVWQSTDYGAAWTLMTAGAGWSPRAYHTSIAMPDGSIVLMGGKTGGTRSVNDVWRSTDNGATWTQVTAGAGWMPRAYHTSVAMPDSSIVLMGGGRDLNDVWRFAPAGSRDLNPSHVYTVPGNYTVALQVYNATGYTSVRKPGYVTVTGEPVSGMMFFFGNLKMPEIPVWFFSGVELRIFR